MSYILSEFVKYPDKYLLDIFGLNFIDLYNMPFGQARTILTLVKVLYKNSKNTESLENELSEKEKGLLDENKHLREVIEKHIHSLK